MKLRALFLGGCGDVALDFFNHVFEEFESIRRRQEEKIGESRWQRRLCFGYHQIDRSIERRNFSSTRTRARLEAVNQLLTEETKFEFKYFIHIRVQMTNIKDASELQVSSQI